MQRKNEWINIFNKDYFDRRFAEPYRSTIFFCDWLEKIGLLNSENPIKILDIGTGKGANIYYMAK